MIVDVMKWVQPKPAGNGGKIRWAFATGQSTPFEMKSKLDGIKGSGNGILFFQGLRARLASATPLFDCSKAPGTVPR